MKWQKMEKSIRDEVEKVYEAICKDEKQLVTSESRGIFRVSTVSGISGKTLVDWLVTNNHCPNQTSACRMGQYLLDGGFLDSAHVFQSDTTKFKLVPTNSTEFIGGVLRCQNVLHQGELQLPGLLCTTKVYGLITSETFFLFNSSDRSQLHQLAVEVVADDDSNAAAFYCNPIKCIAANEEDKMTWINAMVKAGAVYNEKVELDQVNNFFELVDRTIDGVEAPMKAYEGKVCLVVNVASF